MKSPEQKVSENAAIELLTDFVALVRASTIEGYRYYGEPLHQKAAEVQAQVRELLQRETSTISKENNSDIIEALSWALDVLDLTDAHLKKIDPNYKKLDWRVNALCKNNARKVLATAIVGENADTQRLDWWIQLTRYHRTVRVYECETPKGEKYWCCELTQPYERFSGNNPRAAIDAARGAAPQKDLRDETPPAREQLSAGTGEYLDQHEECCADWETGTEAIMEPIVLAQVRSASYKPQFKRWEFCPWCGKSRRVAPINKLPHASKNTNAPTRKEDL